MKRVDKKIAIALKEIGYVVPCDGYFFAKSESNDCIGSMIRSSNYNSGGSLISAPYPHEVVEWLDSKGLHVFQDAHWLGGELVYTLKIINDRHERYEDGNKSYPSRTAAIEAGVDKAIEIYKQRNPQQ